MKNPFHIDAECAGYAIEAAVAACSCGCCSDGAGALVNAGVCLAWIRQAIGQ